MGDAGEGDVEQQVRVQHLVHALVHVRPRKAAVQVPQPHLHRWLQVQGFTRQGVDQAKGSCRGFRGCTCAQHASSNPNTQAAPRVSCRAISHGGGTRSLDALRTVCVMQYPHSTRGRPIVEIDWKCNE